jgi:hypothetical protein
MVQRRVRCESSFDEALSKNLALALGRAAQRNDAMSIFRELLEFLATRKKFWLAPIILLFAAFGAFFTLAQGSVVAPLIYTLF